MVSRAFQKSSRHSSAKSFLFKKRIPNAKCICPESPTQNPGTRCKGFIELEMLLWIFVITLILGGFFEVHRHFTNQHLLLQQEFKHEWNSIHL